MTTDTGLADGIDETTKNITPPAPDNREVKEVVRNEADVTKPGERPEGLPDELWNAEAKDINKAALLEAYQKEQKRVLDLRKTISKGIPKAPEKVEDYKLELEEDVKAFAPEGDPAVKVFTDVAHKHGLSQEQYKGVMNDYLKGLKAAGLAEPKTVETPEQKESREAAEVKDFLAQEEKKLGDDGVRTLNEISSIVSDGFKNGSLNKDDLEAFKNAAFDANGVRFLKKFMTVAAKLPSNGHHIPNNHALNEGLMTREELDAMGLDPRMKTDPSFREKRTNGYKALDARGALKPY